MNAVTKAIEKLKSSNEGENSPHVVAALEALAEEIAKPRTVTVTAKKASKKSK